MSSRWPKVGDLLVEKSNDQEYIGLIYHINPSDSVFITWSDKKPFGYYEQFGYSATNIHNQYHKYSLVRT